MEGEQSRRLVVALAVLVLAQRGCFSGCKSCRSPLPCGHSDHTLEIDLFIILYYIGNERVVDGISFRAIPALSIQGTALLYFSRAHTRGLGLGACAPNTT